MNTRIYIDPETLELVTPSGKRFKTNGSLPLIAGGSATFPTDDNASGGDDDIDLDLDGGDDDDRRVQDDDDGDDDDGDKDEDKFVPKAELDRAKAALKNERRARKNAQREYEERVKKLESETTESSVVEVEKARIDERNKRDAYWTEEIVRAKAEAEFAAQGATSEMAGRLAELVKLKNVEWDETSREWDGLEDEVDAIINANPEFFKPKGEESPTPRRQLPGRPRVDGASRGSQGGGAPRKKPTTAQILAGQALGTGRNRRRG